MSLQALLGELSLAEFLEQYFHRLPFSAAMTAAPLCRAGSWEALADILQQPNVDCMVVRAGQQHAGPMPPQAAEARALMDEGFTILVRHAELHDESLRQFAEAFRRDLQAPVNIHLYATPPGHHGFGWHYDAEDVFVLQTAGTKLYSLRKNTVHPWPLVETLPVDMHYPSEIMPLMRVELHAGDWLYIPCGYWHKAEAPSEPQAGPIDLANQDTATAVTGQPAISLALGVMSPAAINVLDFLRPQLVDALLWRQRLPVPSDPDALQGDANRADLSGLLSQLADELAKVLREPRTAERLLEWLRQPK